MPFKNSSIIYVKSLGNNKMCLSIDEKRVIVEAGEYKLAELLSKRGFNVIPCEFKYFHTFGGGFHCATLDIRRQGSNASYFS